MCSYLADEHTLADGPTPGNWAEMPWIPVHPTLPNGPPQENLRANYPKIKILNKSCCKSLAEISNV